MLMIPLLSSSPSKLRYVSSSHYMRSKMLTRAQWNLAARVEGTPSVRASILKVFQSQITSLESEITSTRSELEALRESSQLASSDAAAAAAVEHAALLKARADLEEISIETSALKSAHTAALDELQQKAVCRRGEGERGREARVRSLLP
jgi:flagellar biosynthesis chaperone FliJ